MHTWSVSFVAGDGCDVQNYISSFYDFSYVSAIYISLYASLTETMTRFFKPLVFRTWFKCHYLVYISLEPKPNEYASVSYGANTILIIDYQRLASVTTWCTCHLSQNQMNMQVCHMGQTLYWYRLSKAGWCHYLVYMSLEPKPNEYASVSYGANTVLIIENQRAG